MPSRQIVIAMERADRWMTRGNKLLAETLKIYRANVCSDACPPAVQEESRLAVLGATEAYLDAIADYGYYAKEAKRLGNQ